MNSKKIALAVISTLIVAGAYLLVDKYLISKGPLQILDWSGRVLTTEEHQRLYDELRIELVGLTAPSGIKLSGLVRSVSEPRRVCGLIKHKDKNGRWLDWDEFAVKFYPQGGVSLFGGIHRDEDYKGTVYLKNGVVRPLRQDDRVECEPVSPCTLCFGRGSRFAG